MQGQSVDARIRPHRMAQLGVTRTFQSIRLFGGPVRARSRDGGISPPPARGHLARICCRPAAAVDEELAFRRQAMALLQFVGIAERAHELAQQPALRPAAFARDRASAWRMQPRAAAARRAGRRRQSDRRSTAWRRSFQTSGNAGVTQVVIEHHMELIMGISDVVSGARLRREDRGGNGSGGPAQPEGDRGLPRLPALETAHA